MAGYFSMGLFDFGKKVKHKAIKGIAKFEHGQERARKREVKRLSSVAEVEEQKARIRKAKNAGRRKKDSFGLKGKLRQGKSGGMRLI